MQRGENVIFQKRAAAEKAGRGLDFCDRAGADRQQRLPATRGQRGHVQVDLKQNKGEKLTARRPDA